MPNTREKLMKIVREKATELPGIGVSATQTLRFVDHLVANGVTVQNWIPVSERLPESQNPVLVVAVSKGMGFPYIFKAAHIGHQEITTDEYGWTDGEYDTEYDEENDCFWISECWYECNAVEGNTNWVMDEDYTITHWMPLPQPPKGE